MKNSPTAAQSSKAPRQLSMALGSTKLWGMSLPERGTLLARLVSLLIEAAGLAAGGHDDDER